MAVNKVVLNTTDGEETLIDLTQDTVTADTLVFGVTAHGADGEAVVGTMDVHTRLDDHIADTDNPHQVTAEQVGADPSGTASGAVSDHNASSSAHSSLFGAKADAAALTAHTGDGSNPHGVTLSQVGVTAGTTDLTAGSSALATGRVYLVYE